MKLLEITRNVMFIYAHRRLLFSAKYYLHRCMFNYFMRITVRSPEQNIRYAIYRSTIVTVSDGIGFDVRKHKDFSIELNFPLTILTMNSNKIKTLLLIQQPDVQRHISTKSRSACSSPTSQID